MNATICGYPATCPHGSHQACNGAWATYADGCATTSGYPMLFWAGGIASGTAVWPNKYLADWDEALVLNAGDDLYDEAARLNWNRKVEGQYPDGCVSAIEHAYCRQPNMRCQFRGLISKRPCLLPDGHEEPHDVWGWAAGKPVEYEPCGCLTNSANAHRASCPEYLGEVPWTDRVED